MEVKMDNVDKYWKELLDSGLTERKLENFFQRQERYKEIQRKAIKMNRQKLGYFSTPMAITSPKQLVQMAHKSGRKPANIIRALEQKQREEKKNLEKEITSEIKREIIEAIDAISPLYKIPLTHVENIAKNISNEQLQGIGLLKKQLVEYKTQNRKGKYSTGLINAIQILESAIYEILLQNIF